MVLVLGPRVVALGDVLGEAAGRLGEDGPQVGVALDEAGGGVGGQPEQVGDDQHLGVDVEFLGGGVDPWGNQRIGFSGVVPEINREDWGLTWNAALETGGFLLSRSVRLEIEAELVRK